MSIDNKEYSNIYLPNGYCNVGGILDFGMPFTIIIGGRGTGKTFTALKVCRDRKLNTLLLRRTHTQAEMIARKDLSPWKSVALFDNFDFRTDNASKGLYQVVEIDDEDNDIRTLSFITGLSTISNLRGFDSSDIDIIVYDEFIPESHERPLKRESDALLNAYETINRNRELSGRQPVKLLMMANANRLDSPILMGLGLTNKIESMIKKKQMYSIMPEKGVVIVILQDSPISKKKEETALYKLVKGTQFGDMSLNNEFSYSDTSNVVSKDLNGYSPILYFDDITIYRSKADQKLYASAHNSGSLRHYNSTSDEDLRRLRNNGFFMTIAILRNNIEYESYEIKAKVMNVFLL